MYYFHIYFKTGFVSLISTIVSLRGIRYEMTSIVMHTYWCFFSQFMTFQEICPPSGQICPPSGQICWRFSNTIRLPLFMKNGLGNSLTVDKEIITKPGDLLVKHSYFIFCSDKQ